MFLLNNEDKQALQGIKRIGFLGGSFNPPHLGHLHIAKIALEELKLDTIWWLLAPSNPYKNGLAPVSARADAINKIISPYSKMYLSMAEVNWGFSHTIDTINAINANISDEIVKFFIMGEDVWKSMKNWKQPEEVIKKIPIAVVKRASSLFVFNKLAIKYMFYKKDIKSMQNKVHAPAWCYINSATVDISSTTIRKTYNKNWWEAN